MVSMPLYVPGPVFRGAPIITTDSGLKNFCMSYPFASFLFGGYGKTALTGDACLAKSAPCIQPDVSGSMGALHPGLLFLEQDLKTFKLVVTFFTERIAGAAPDASPTLSRGIEKTICQMMFVWSGAGLQFSIRYHSS